MVQVKGRKPVWPLLKHAEGGCSAVPWLLSLDMDMVLSLGALATILRHPIPSGYRKGTDTSG